jgi:hypothetical protein
LPSNRGDTLVLEDCTASEIGCRDIGTIDTLVLRNVGIDKEDTIQLRGECHVAIVMDLHYSDALQKTVQACRDADDGDGEYESTGCNVDLSNIKGLKWIVDIGSADNEEGCWCVSANKLPAVTENDSPPSSIAITNGECTISLHVSDDETKTRSVTFSEMIEVARKHGLSEVAAQYLSNAWIRDSDDEEEHEDEDE